MDRQLSAGRRGWPSMAAAKPAAPSRAAPTQGWTAAPDPAPAPGSPQAAARPAMDDRSYALLLHLSSLSWLISIPGFIGPLVMWLIKKDQSPFIDRHGRAAMDFQISLFIYVAAAVLLFVVITIATLGLGALPMLLLTPIAILVIIVLVIVLPILAGVKANQGQEYDYPLSLRILRQRPQ